MLSTFTNLYAVNVPPRPLYAASLCPAVRTWGIYSLATSIKRSRIDTIGI
jgi:hypothetical protein